MFAFVCCPLAQVSTVWERRAGRLVMCSMFFFLKVSELWIGKLS